jgi:hypothetical protein
MLLQDVDAAIVEGLPGRLHDSGEWLKLASYFTVIAPVGHVGGVPSEQLQLHTLDVFGPS